MSQSGASLIGVWNRFIDQTAQAIEANLDRLRSSYAVVLTESAVLGRLEAHIEHDGRLQPLGSVAIGPDGSVSGPAASAVVSAVRSKPVHLVLHPSRFLLRDLPLPAQASAFADKILHTQIDRLTPWSAERAVFGHAVLRASGDSVTLILAAADKDSIEPLVGAMQGLKPRAVQVFCGPSPADGAPAMSILRRDLGGMNGAARRQALAALLIAVGLTAAAANLFAFWRDADLTASYQRTQARITALRGGLTSGDPLADVERRALARKVGTPSATMILESVSQFLPDDSWLTALDIAGDAVRLTGVSPDPAALVSLIEQTGLLADANFFAPTTRGPIGKGEQFHIEARMKRAVGSQTP